MKILALAGLIAVGFSACTPTKIGSWWLARSLSARPPEFAVRVEPGTTMTTSHGISLVAYVYHPQTAGPMPTILVRVPYSKTFLNKFFATVVGRFWAERGYTVVIQGTRGRYQSGGSYYPLRHERQGGVGEMQTVWLGTDYGR